MTIITAEHQLALERVNHPPDAACMAIGRWPESDTTWGLYISEQQPAGVVVTAAAGIGHHSYLKNAYHRGYTKRRLLKIPGIQSPYII